MRRLFVIACVTCAVVVGIWSPVAAAAETEGSRWVTSAKIGVFYPTHGTMRSQTAPEWWYLGIEVDPGFRYKPANGTIRFGVDFDFRQAQGRGVFTIPLLAKVTWPIATSENGIRLYGGLGPGAYFMNSRYSGAVAKPGIQFVAGLDLGESLFIEGAYDWVSAFYDDNDTPLRADAVKVAIGIRF